MNVLLFVMTILMLLSMMTYARFESYRAQVVAQKQFEAYMTSAEKKIFTELADKRYKETVVQTAKERKDAAAKSGSSRLSWLTLLNPQERQKLPDKTAYIDKVTKTLMRQLFFNYPDFQKEYEKDEAVLDHLLQAIVNAAEALPEEKKIKRLSDLLLLELEDPHLDRLFYTMIKSTPTKAIPKKKETDEPIIDKEETESEEDTFSTTDGSISLLNHLTLSPQRMRLFLLSELLLFAVFEDAKSVKMVEELRYDLYRKVRSKQLNPEQASSEFKAKLTSLYPFLTDFVFDFRISKVNPRNYE